jgi:hypothetical protein
MTGRSQRSEMNRVTRLFARGTNDERRRTQSETRSGDTNHNSKILFINLFAADRVPNSEVD